MEVCSKMRAGAVPALLDDALVEILSRVPARSACRFKCVSKAWRDLIDDPNNSKKLRQPMQGPFVKVSEVNDDDESDDDELDHISFSFINLPLTSVPLDIDPSLSFLPEMEMTGSRTFLLDSCNGLILLGHSQEQFGPNHYTVCNPTTKQWSAMPACGSGGLVSYTYLAFSPAVSSHFHLVLFQMPDLYVELVALHVYSSETGTWSQNQIDEGKVQGELEGWHHQYTLIRGTPNNLCAFVNGFLHVMFSASDLLHILVVDVQGKARRLITVPIMADGRHGDTYVCYLGESQGHLHCVTKESIDKKNAKLSIWVLQDYDSQEWVLKNTVNSLDVFPETGGMIDFQVVDIHQDCNVVLFINQCDGKLIAYNMDRKEVSVMATFEHQKEPCDYDFARYNPSMCILWKGCILLATTLPCAYYGRVVAAHCGVSNVDRPANLSVVFRATASGLHNNRLG